MSTSTRSAPRLDAAAIASNTTEPGSAPSWPRTSSPPVRSAQSRELVGRGGAERVGRGEHDALPVVDLAAGASLPIVVVFPTPLTPTNIHTLGSPATTRSSVAVDAASRIATTSSRTRRDQRPGRVADCRRLARAAPRRGCAVVVGSPTSASSSASSSSSQVSSSILRPRMPAERADERARGAAEAGRAAAASRTAPRGLLESPRRRLGVDVGDDVGCGASRFELGDRLVDRRVGRGGGRSRRAACRSRRTAAVARPRHGPRGDPTSSEAQREAQPPASTTTTATMMTTTITAAQARSGPRHRCASSNSRSRIRWLTTRLDPPGGIDTP